MILPSPSLANLAPALVAAQAELPVIHKDKTATVPIKGGGSYTYKYADLGPIVALCRPIIFQHGLGITQFGATIDGGPGLATMLLHSSGEWLVDETPLPVSLEATPQAWGSAYTYFRRYNWCSVLGIVADEDDAGRAAQGTQGGTGSRRNAGRADKSSEAAPTLPASGASSGEARAPADRGDNTLPAWHRDLMKAFSRIGLGGDTKEAHDARLVQVERAIGRRVESTRDLQAKEAGAVIRAIGTGP